MDNRRAPLFAGLAVAGVAILMVLLLVLPKMSQVSTAQDQLDQAQRHHKTIAEVNQRIPATAEEPGLILLLQNAAISAGIDLVSLSPGTPVFDTAVGLSKIAVGVSATGTYFDVTDFMYQIETLPRAAIVTNLSLAPGETSQTGVPLLTLSATIQTYTTDT